MAETQQNPAADPDSLAVALKHDPAQDGPPRVVAQGRGRAAEQILELAFAHGVKVRADADLARVLAVLDLDSPIPLEAFAAVAEILVYVYQANGRLAAAALAGEGRP
jgi:flagellar biosynthesis protein